MDIKALEEQLKVLTLNLKPRKGAVSTLRTNTFTGGRASTLGRRLLGEATQEFQESIERWTQLVSRLDHSDKEEGEDGRRASSR